MFTSLVQCAVHFSACAFFKLRLYSGSSSWRIFQGQGPKTCRCYIRSTYDHVQEPPYPGGGYPHPSCGYVARQVQPPSLDLPDRCCQMLPARVLPDAPRCCQILPDAPRCHQMIPDSARCWLMLPRPIRIRIRIRIPIPIPIPTYNQNQYQCIFRVFPRVIS